MLEFIKKTDVVKTEQLKMLLFGQPGSGKTSISFTAEKPLLIDFDGGIHRACYRMDAVRARTWQDVIDLQKSKEIKELAPKTLVIDTVGSMLDSYIADYVKKEDPKNSRRGGELSQQGYGAMKGVFSQFMDWAKMQKINLVFIAHVTEQKDGVENVFIPKVTGGSYDLLRQSMDLIGYVHMHLNNRVIDFAPKDGHIGKDCAEIGMIEIPDYRKADYRDFLSDIFSTVLNRINALTENQQKILEKLDKYRAEADELQDVDSFNKSIESLSKEKDKGMRVQMWEVLKKAASDKGVGYDKEKKQFEDISNVQA